MAFTIFDALDECGVRVEHRTQQIKCPIHKGGNEVKASCRVYADTDSLYCFTCGAAHNPISLVAAIKEWNYGRALAYVQEKYIGGDRVVDLKNRRNLRASSLIAQVLSSISFIPELSKRIDMIRDLDPITVAAAQGETDREIGELCVQFNRKWFPTLAS